MSSLPDKLVVGTRGSKLARAQSQWVMDQLQTAWPQLHIEMRILTTTGDRQADQPLPAIGGKGLFTDELERALLGGEIDVAVHSCKDLPTELNEGLGVLAYPKREDPRDAWVSGDGTPFDSIPPGSTIGTGSLRRQAQLLMRRPDLQFINLRGNVDTRISKIKRGDCAGAVLAMAGLKRAALAEHMTHPFEANVCLSAPGQGALALEGRLADERTFKWLAPLHDDETATAVECERAILEALDAGCRAPVAVLATLTKSPDAPRDLSPGVGDSGTLNIEALVSTPRGERWVRTSQSSDVAQASELVQAVLRELRAGGADEIVAQCRHEG